MVGQDTSSLSPLSPEYVDGWYKRVSEDPLYWMIDVKGRCIGVAKLHSLEESNRRARYATAIFDPSDWGHGYGTETTRFVLDYAFNELSLHRVDLRVLSSNKRAITCYKKCGFVTEGVERETVLISGEWDGDVLMSILEHEYK